MDSIKTNNFLNTNKEIHELRNLPPKVDNTIVIEVVETPTQTLENRPPKNSLSKQTIIANLIGNLIKGRTFPEFYIHLSSEFILFHEIFELLNEVEAFIDSNKKQEFLDLKEKIKTLCLNLDFLSHKIKKNINKLSKLINNNSYDKKNPIFDKFKFLDYALTYMEEIEIKKIMNLETSEKININQHFFEKLNSKFQNCEFQTTNLIKKLKATLKRRELTGKVQVSGNKNLDPNQSQNLGNIVVMITRKITNAQSIIQKNMPKAHKSFNHLNPSSCEKTNNIDYTSLQEIQNIKTWLKNSLLAFTNVIEICSELINGIDFERKEYRKCYEEKMELPSKPSDNKVLATTENNENILNDLPNDSFLDPFFGKEVFSKLNELGSFQEIIESLGSLNNSLSSLVNTVSKFSKQNEKIENKARGSIKKTFDNLTQNNQNKLVIELDVIYTEISNFNNKLKNAKEDLKDLILDIDHWHQILDEKTKTNEDVDWCNVFYSEIQEEETIQKRKLQRKKIQTKVEKIQQSDLNSPKISTQVKSSKIYLQFIKESQHPLENDGITEKKLEEPQEIEEETHNEKGATPVKNSVFSLLKKMENNLSNTFHKCDVLVKSQIQQRTGNIKFGLKILAAGLEIKRALELKEEKDLFPSMNYIFYKNSSVMLEQYLSCKVLEKNEDSFLSHDHKIMIENLESNKNFSKKIKLYQDIFTAVNNGCLTSRYPYQISHYDKEKSFSKGVDCLLKETDLNSLALRSLEFIDKENTKEISLMLEKKDINDFALPEKPHTKMIICQIKEQIERIEEIEKLFESLDNSQNDQKNIKENQLYQDIFWHLKGLKEALMLMQMMPHAKYILLHGDTILNHLQWMLELSLKVKIAEKGDGFYNSHDLEDMAFKMEKKSPETSDFLQSFQDLFQELNASYGGHYPYSRLGSIDHYNNHHKEEPIEVPASLQWRIDAEELFLKGNRIDYSEKKCENIRRNFVELNHLLYIWIQRSLDFTQKIFVS